jgi:hypothetical protein
VTGAGGPRPRFVGNGVVLRGRRWLLMLGCVFEVLGVVVLARHFMDWRGQWIMASSGLLVIGNVGLSLYWWSARKWPQRTSVRLIADKDSLRIDSAFTERSAFTAGYRLAAPEHAVRLVRARRFSQPLDLELATPEKAIELVAALGLSVTDATARFQAVYGGLMRRVLTAAAAMAVFVALFTALEIFADRLTGRGLPPGFNVLLTMAPSLLPLLSQLVLMTTVDVGADGIWLSRGNVFLPYSELVQVAVDTRDLVLVRKSGRPIRLGFGGTEQQSEACAACVKRIEEARAAFANVGAAVRPEALLRPGGRSTVEWLKALRAIADYRSSAVPEDTLWRIVEDPTAAAPMRAGAAVALARDLDDEARLRLRVAAQACAAPKLRVAFELVAEDAQADEARLHDALEQVLTGT